MLITDNTLSLTTMETLPDALILEISQFLADPAAVTRFSETNERTRRVLHPPLRIQIQEASIVREEQGSWLLTGSLETLALEADANSTRPYRMPGTFFVSTIDNPARLLRTSDTLVYGEKYLFWVYDKTIKCRVYLERNARIGRRKLTPEREWDETGFYLGLSPTSKRKSTLGNHR